MTSPLLPPLQSWDEEGDGMSAPLEKIEAPKPQDALEGGFI